MRIFVTGASGFVGSAVVQELLGAGHSVLGLARSDAAAEALSAAGAEVHRGDLTDLDSLRNGAGNADGVIHTGFNHDFSRFAENCETDRLAIAALGEALQGSDQPLIVTSGIGLLEGGGLATEDFAPRTGPGSTPRRSEQAAAEAADRGVNTMIVRLPPSVHGAGDHGFVPILIDIARRTGRSAQIGAGSNLWPAVHRFDAAKLYLKALELGKPGARYHAVAEQGVPFREIAAVIAHGLGVPVAALSPEEAAEHFTWFSHFAAMDCAASSERTRAELGWRPVEPGLIADIESAGYFGG